jgi:Zn ribbon nucleic-acid-binding protein
MGLSDAIRRRGFRRWYERQLIEGHAYLVTGLLALIMMAISIEMIDFRQSAQGLIALLMVGAAGSALTLFAWRQFTFLLARAEYLAGRATCPACRTYARFAIDRVDDNPQAVAGCTLHVQCRKCGHQWSIA